ncbi:MAG: RNA-binding protein [Alphaproteobacteria bacterium]|nr:RNA-binding protein [Alphaproteobacteria bacterium]MCW5741012.1 RNA-binding protein [Alphaproteobacteria bacterium]
MLDVVGTETADATAVVASGDDERGPLRTCLATGEVLPRERLMRFVVGPDGQVVPDLAGRLPGRGLWLTPTRAALEKAIARKAFARGARRQVSVDAGLADLIERQLLERALGALGFARRGGHAVSGFAKVEERLRGRKIALVVVATDAQDSDGRAKLAGWGVRMVAFCDAATLGRIFGRENATYIGIARGAAASVAAAIDRFLDFRGRMDAGEGYDTQASSSTAYRGSENG